MSNLDQRLENNVSKGNKNICEIPESMDVLTSETKSELAKISKRIDVLEINGSKREKNMDLINHPFADGENLQTTISAISRILNFDDVQSIHTPRSNGQEIAEVKSMPVIVKFATLRSRRHFHVKYFEFTKSDALKIVAYWIYQRQSDFHQRKPFEA